MKLEIRIWVARQAFLCLIYLRRVFSSYHRRQQSQGIGFFLLVQIVFAALGLILGELLGDLGSIYCRPMQRHCPCFDVPLSLFSSFPICCAPRRTCSADSGLIFLFVTQFLTPLFSLLSLLFQTKTHSSNLAVFQHTLIFLSMKQASFYECYPCLVKMYQTS